MEYPPRDVKLYNVLFPFWMLLMFPITWAIVLPGNFIIDSLVLLLVMAILKRVKTLFSMARLDVFRFVTLLTLLLSTKID